MSPSLNTNGSNGSGGSSGGGGRHRHSSANNQMVMTQHISQNNKQQPRTQPHLQHNNVMFKLPNNLKLRLCKALDAPPHLAGQKDWRALAEELHLELYISFFGGKPSPTECILTLWEAQQQTNSQHMTAMTNPMDDLISSLQKIGRKDIVAMMETDVGPWV